MKLFLTGANGFLGSHLVRHWCSAGHNVSGTYYPSYPGGANLAATGARMVPFSLADDFPPEELLDQDVVLHLAYDRGASVEVNAAGTWRVFEAARGRGVPRQIFFSSYSARPNAASEYGRLKYELEERFLKAGECVVRPGLVIGYGGLFGRNMETILRSPVMPLLDGGRLLLPLIGIGDLVAGMSALLGGRVGAFNLFHPELVTMRRLIEAVNRAAGHRTIYLTIPHTVAAGALKVARVLPVRVPVDGDNLRALKQNQAAIHVSDLPELLDKFQSIDEIIAGAVEARRRGQR